MNYIGSKLSLLDFLYKSISGVVDEKTEIFCDLFSGTGAVGGHFKKKGYKIIANDIQYYSYALNKHYIGNCRDLTFAKLREEVTDLKNCCPNNKREVVCRYLSDLDGVNGFIYKNYCHAGTKNERQTRIYFSDKNARKCDAIRIKIEQWMRQEMINGDEYYFLIASLVESIDKCANTASVYGAFLKKLKKSAQVELQLRPAELILSDWRNEVFNEDANNLITEIKADILYLDPPYNHRQYAANYHLLETIAKYDSPHVYGKTGLRNYRAQVSDYCSKNRVKHSFAELIMRARAKYIFLSYNNEGLMSLREIEEIMASKGEYGCFNIDHVRFKADRAENRNYKANKTVEYLHYAKCG